MKAHITIQNDNSTDQKFLEKIGAGEHRDHPSFDLGDMDYEGVSLSKCNSCGSQRIQIISNVLGRRIRCHECGHDEWN
jgi:hypothetical protein